MPGPASTPNVFISYSWTSDNHVTWVIRLAERLVGDGVDVILDQWDLMEGHDKYAFMERMVTDALVSKVLAVCDERYATKADGREGGVGTESQIISKDIYDQVKQEKFIPLLLNRTMSAYFATAHPGGGYTLCREADKPLRPGTMAKAFENFFRGSKWGVLRGYHVFRHSFASNLARVGIEEKVVDELMGHQTESMRRRYRHLFPEQRENAIKTLFG